MTIRGTLIIAAGLALIVIGGQTIAQPAPGKSVADEIIQITKAQWAAEIKKDLTEATKHIAADYTEFNGEFSTRVDGKELASRFMEAGLKDAGKILAAEMLNPKVQVYGDVAILTYNYAGVSQDKDGNMERDRAKSTRVYAKQGGTWMLVHANFATDPKPEGD